MKVASIAFDATGKTLAGFLHHGAHFATVATKPRRFVKDVLMVGIWTHPLTERVIEFDRPRLERLADLSNRWLEAGHKIPFTSGHDESVEANRGFVIGPFSVTTDDKLVTVIEVIKEDTVEGILDGTLDAVSVNIDFDIIESDSGVTFPEVITHIAATNFPVITGQDEFKALSQKVEAKAGRAIFLSGAPKKREGEIMDLKIIAKLLGLPEDSDEKAVKAALDAKIKEAEKGGTATASLAALSAGLKAHGLKVDGEKVVKVEITEPKPGDDPEKLEMRKRLTVLEFSGVKDRLASANRIAEAAVRDGKIPPTLKPVVAKILSAAKGVETLSLSTDGEKIERVAMDLLTAGQELIDGLPAFTEPGTGLSTHSGTAPEGGGKTASEAKKESLEAAGKAVAERMNPPEPART